MTFSVCGSCLQEVSQCECSGAPAAAAETIAPYLTVVEEKAADPPPSCLRCRICLVYRRTEDYCSTKCYLCTRRPDHNDWEEHVNRYGVRHPDDPRPADPNEPNPPRPTYACPACHNTSWTAYFEARGWNSYNFNPDAGRLDSYDRETTDEELDYFYCDECGFELHGGDRFADAWNELYRRYQESDWN